MAAPPAGSRLHSAALPAAPASRRDISAVPAATFSPTHETAPLAEPPAIPSANATPRFPAPPQSISARTSDPASPRIHIGTIEVRTTPPPAPQPSPPAAPVPTGASRDSASVPVSRGYGWRFGLSQG